MPGATTKSGKSRTHPEKQASVVDLLSGWAKQGVETFFATQRIFLDLAIRQYASVAQLLREQFTDPRRSPSRVLTELTGEGVANFIEAQKVLLNLAQEQNKIVMTGVQERVGASTTASALADVLRRSVENFISMQHEFLKIAGRQTHRWLEAAKEGKPFEGKQWIDLAREATENFIHAQKRFLDLVAEQTQGGKRAHASGRKIKRTELSELARQAVDSFIDAQKELFDVAGRQVKVNVKAAGKAMDLVRPFPLVPLADLTRQGVKSYVDASKALMDVLMRRDAGKQKPTTQHRAKRQVHRVKPEAAQAAVA